MKTIIYISGQINGNFKLRNAIHGADEIKDAGFGNFKMIFGTKKQAKKSLWEAFKNMRREMPDEVGRISGLNYSKYGMLLWDASKAEIVSN